MLASALNLFFLLCIGFATAIPVPATELLLMESVSAPVAPSLVTLRADTSPHRVRTVSRPHTEPSGQGSKIFASAQWERSVPSGVREAREPESTIFNHNQWDDPDLADTAPRSSSLIFAHAQWEERRIEARPESQQVKRPAYLPPAPNDAERSSDQVPNSRFEREHSTAVESAEIDESKSKDISTGPVFFAHVQWEES
ncbi:hypothetical protein K438DRAFT_2009720 [Mycena galopus ATCC 62051]|nr:hypothetical protein K438DRAFT_2009720 [Mycena galopus ATCC 62051]